MTDYYVTVHDTRGTASPITTSGGHGRCFARYESEYGPFSSYDEAVAYIHNLCLDGDRVTIRGVEKP